jgi:hypothetical protein
MVLQCDENATIMLREMPGLYALRNKRHSICINKILAVDGEQTPARMAGPSNLGANKGFSSADATT